MFSYQVYFLGIDASKGYADFVLIDAQERIVEPAFQLDDTFEGHARLHAMLRRFCASHPEAVIHAAAESTGGLREQLAGWPTPLPSRLAAEGGDRPVGESHPPWSPGP